MCGEGFEEFKEFKEFEHGRNSGSQRETETEEAG
jgi:hypothetical protein